MDDLRTRAQLVGFEPAGAGAGAIGTVISWAEVAEAKARGEFPATLLLDLERIEPADGGEVTAHARVAVEWDEKALEQLLASTDDPQIALWFDKDGLGQAFDEVEGHGLREKVAVLAVVAAAAGASAHPSFGMVAGPGGAGTAVAPATYSLAPDAPTHGAVNTQPAGAERGVLQNEQTGVTQTQATTADAATGTTGLSSGELAGIAAGAGALLISAAGFGAARKRHPPALPA